MKRLPYPFATAFLIVALGIVGAPRAFSDDPQDIVYLKDGTQRAGIIDEESPTAVRLRVKLGAVWIERSEIARIEKAPTVLEQYKKHSTELKPGDAEACFALAVWCREKGLPQQSSELLAKTLEIDPEHAGANRELGRIKIDGKWVSEEEHMKARGFVKHGDRWVSPMCAKISELVDEYMADKKTREMVYGALNEMGAGCHETIAEMLDSDVAALCELMSTPRLDAACGELKITYQRSRTRALSLILDSSRYNEQENAHPVRAEVRNLVSEVVSIFKKPLEYYFEHADELREVRERIDILADYSERRAQAVGKWKEKLQDELSRATLVVNKSIFEDDDALFPFCKENKATIAANVDAEQKLKPEEAAMAKLINEYRHIMGLRVLGLNPRLNRAAFKHSAEMLEKNYFSHDSPDPQMRGVDRRTLAEGFRGLYVGENIAKGDFSSEEIMQAWIDSPGHHRNLLNTIFFQLGVGKDGQYWTAVFGGKEWK